MRKSIAVTHRTWWLFAALLFIQTALLTWCALSDSPTVDEMGHLPAGLSHWTTGHFDMYRVNPPLVRLVASLPVLAASHEGYSYKYVDDQRNRLEYAAAHDFAARAGTRIFWWMTIARWACVPFSWIGAYVCYSWARELYGGAAGWVALVAWCFSPMVLAFGHLITPDAAASSLGIAAAWSFWKWLRGPGWKVVFWTGLMLGLAELTKSTWIVLFGMWPGIWLVWRLTERRTGADGIYDTEKEPQSPRHTAIKEDGNAVPYRDMSASAPRRRRWISEGKQLAVILAIGLYILNLGYGFEGSLETLGKFSFVSDLLGGPENNAANDESGVRNRFAGTWMGELPVPLPRNYVLGIDVQRLDFERKLSSYLRGEWRDGGWWYYYLYALLIKEPLGTWLLLVLSLGLGWLVKGYAIAWRDELVLLAPAIVVLVLISSQTGFNHHARYVLPCLPFAFIWISRVARCVEFKHWKVGAIAGGLLLWSVGSSIYYYPHSMSYFNELVGGPRGGHFYLGNSNIDWGQDLLYLKQWYEDNPEARPLHLACNYWIINLDVAEGIHYVPVPAGPAMNRPDAPVTRNWPWLIEDPRSPVAPPNSSGESATEVPHPSRSSNGAEATIRNPSTTGLAAHPDDQSMGPQPGWFVVSVIQIHRRQGDLEYFLEFDPVTTIGYSMNVYHITLNDANRVRRKLGQSELTEH